jgi:hypothetical protein
MRIQRYLLASLGAFGLLACTPPASDNGDAGPSGDDAAEGCVTMTVGTFAPGAIPGWVVAPATDPTGQITSAFVRVELNEHAGFMQTTGDFDLSKETNYYLANHTVVLLTGSADPDSASPEFVQTSGSMHLDAVTSPVGREIKGSFSSVRLVDSTFDPGTPASTPKPSGQCVFIASGAFDTTVAIGSKCKVVDDCGDTSTKVCDPSTGTCVKSQCDGSAGSCAGSGVCVVQAVDSTAGACYAGCVPFSSSSTCSGDAECISLFYDQSKGACYPRGSAADGAPCTVSDVSTGCVAGSNCVQQEAGAICRKTCNYWAAAPGCPSGQLCWPGSTCSADPVDPAAINANCDATTNELTPCGLDASNNPRGICVSEGAPATMVCRKPCRKTMASDCPSGVTCNDYTPTVGVCR